MAIGNLRFIFLGHLYNIAKENAWVEVPLDVGLFERHDLGAELVIDLQNHVVVFLQSCMILVISTCRPRTCTDHLQYDLWRGLDSLFRNTW